MSVTQVIRASDCPDVPWKNGGGTTREIAVFPPDAGMDDFLWRLSMARVERPGPFSAFAGIDRTLAVVEGKLALTGPELTALMDDASKPLPFDGAMATHGEPVDGPVLDVNAMVRRDRYTCVMTRLSKADSAQCSGAGFLIALVSQVVEGTPLAPFDCVRFDGAVAIDGEMLLIDFYECVVPQSQHPA